MTAWWTSTTSVRKVRARSSATLRALAFGAARISAGAAELEIDVMRAPAGWSFSDVGTGNPIQQGPIIPQQNADVIRPCARHVYPRASARASASGLPGDDLAHPCFPEKVSQ